MRDGIEIIVGDKESKGDKAGVFEMVGNDDDDVIVGDEEDGNASLLDGDGKGVDIVGERLDTADVDGSVGAEGCDNRADTDGKGDGAEGKGEGSMD